MARVFRGKIAIPGDQIEAYLEALGQFEHEKAPLRTQLEQYARDFAHALAQQYAPKTVRKHTLIIDLFIDFVCWDTDVRRIEEITRGIANSLFRQWYLRKVGDRTESELKTAIKKFLQFLDQEKGIRNEVVLKSFQRWPLGLLRAASGGLMPLVARSDDVGHRLQPKPQPCHMLVAPRVLALDNPLPARDASSIDDNRRCTR